MYGLLSAYDVYMSLNTVIINEYYNACDSLYTCIHVYMWVTHKRWLVPDSQHCQQTQWVSPWGSDCMNKL
jgi:hypothetical protein